MKAKDLRTATIRLLIIHARRLPGVRQQPAALLLQLSVTASPAATSIVVVQLPSRMNHLRTTGLSQVTTTHALIHVLLRLRIRTEIVTPALQGALIQGLIKLTALLQEVAIQGVTARHRAAAGV